MDAVGNAVQAPEYQGGASGTQDAVAGLLNSPEYQSPVTTPEQLSDQGANEGGQFGKGLRSSAIKLGSDLNALAGQAGEAMGLTAFAQNRFAQAKHMAERADAASPDVRDPQGVHDLASASDYVEGVMGGAVGSMALPVAAGVLLKNPAAGMAIGMGPQMVGGQVQRLRADPKVMATKTPGEILGNAALTGGAETALMALPIGGAAGIAKKLLSPAERAAGLAAESLKTGAVMGGQMAGTEAISQAGHTMANPERDKSHDTEDIKNALIGGAVGGLGLGAAAHIASAPFGLAKDSFDKAGKLKADAKAKIDEAMAKPDPETVKQVFESEKAPPQDHEYPDHLATDEQVADWLDENTTKTTDFLKKQWESVKDTPAAQKFSDWATNPEARDAFVADVKQKMADSTAAPKVKAIFGGISQYLKRHEQKPDGDSKDSLMRNRLDDQILDHAMERVPNTDELRLADSMTAQHKMQLLDMLKTAAKTGDVPEELIKLYGDHKVAEGVLKNTASMMGNAPASIWQNFAAVAKQREDRNNSVENLVRTHMRPELYTNREMRDTILKNFVPELQDYASTGVSADMPLASLMREGTAKTQSDNMQVVHGRAEQQMVEKLHAAFGDRAELVAAELDKIHQQTTSDRGMESAAKPDLEAQDVAPVEGAPPETPAFQSDARLNRVYSSAEEVRNQIDNLKSEYGRRADFHAVTDKPGEFHIVAHDAIGDESGFDESGWKRLWNPESRKQNKSGVENGVLTVRTKDHPAGQKISTMSLIMEMGSRYGRDGGDKTGSNRVGDLFFRGISQLLSDPKVDKERPFTNVQAGEGKPMKFPDNMKLGKFGGKEYFWKDVKHYVMSHEDMTGVTDEAINKIRATRREDGSLPTRKEAVSIAAKAAREREVKQTTGADTLDNFGGKKDEMTVGADGKVRHKAVGSDESRQGPEYQNAGDNLAVEEADRFARARRASGGEEQGFLTKGAKAGPQGGAVGESPGQRTGKMLKADSSPELTERARPGATIAEQDDFNRNGEKGPRKFAEFTGEELHPPTSAGGLEVTKAELGYKKEIADRVVKNLNNGHVETMVERAKAATDVRALYHTLDTLHEMAPFTERNLFWKRHEGLPDGAKETDNLRQAAKKLEAAVAAKVKELGPRPTETRAQEAMRLKVDAVAKEAPKTVYPEGWSKKDSDKTAKEIAATRTEKGRDDRPRSGDDAYNQAMRDFAESQLQPFYDTYTSRGSSFDILEAQMLKRQKEYAEASKKSWEEDHKNNVATDVARQLKRDPADPGTSRDNAMDTRTDLRHDSKLENTHVSFSDTKVDPNKPLDPETETKIRDYVAKVLGDKADVRTKSDEFFNALEKSGKFAKMNGVETLWVSMHALDPQGIGFHEAAHALFARLAASDPKSKIMLEQIASSPVIMAQLRELLKDHPNALKQLDGAHGSEERVAYMYQFWAGDALKMGPKATTMFERVKNFFKQALATLAGTFDGPGDMARAEQILTAFHSGELAEPNTVKEVLAARNRPGIMERATNMLGPIAEAAGKLVFTSDGLIADMKQPVLDKIRMQFHNLGMDAQNKERGFIGTKGDLTTKYANDWTRAVAGATAADFRLALEHGQNGTRPGAGIVKHGEASSDEMVRKVYAANRKLLDDLYKYQVEAGVKRRTGIKDGKPTYEDIGFLKDYFPRVDDQQYIESHKDEYLAMLKRNGVPDPEAVYKLKMRDSDSITPGADEMDSSVMYFNPHTGKRTLVNIPASELAPFQSKDLAGTMMNYISRAVKRAEYTRRFDNSGEKIQEALAEAKKNGLSEADAKTFNKAIEVMQGTIRPDMNRDLRKVMGGIMTYENIRLLPLSLLSNLVDPWGIMVRGGTLADVGKTYKNALTSIWKANKSEGYDLAAGIGSISEALGDEYMSQAFGHQFISPKAKALNDWFFKYNGMEGWNRQNRAGAAAAAERFLVKHATEPTEHSARYLAELNLSAKEVKDAIVKEPNHAGKLIDHLDYDNPKIREALNSWIDGAIVRPNAAIRPVWQSDPMWMLAAQFKQYTWGVQKILMARVAHEAKNGNMTPAIALASMVPTMIAADMARAALTPGSASSGQKDEWGFMDWVENGIQRVGLTGFGQYGLEMGKPGTSAAYIMGPAANQLMSGFHTTLGTTLKNAVPGGNLIGTAHPVVPQGD